MLRWKFEVRNMDLTLTSYFITERSLFLTSFKQSFVSFFLDIFKSMYEGPGYISYVFIVQGFCENFMNLHYFGLIWYSWLHLTLFVKLVYNINSLIKLKNTINKLQDSTFKKQTNTFYKWSLIGVFSVVVIVYGSDSMIWLSNPANSRVLFC